MFTVTTSGSPRAAARRRLPALAAVLVILAAVAPTAVTGNLTVTQQNYLGYLFIGPIAMNWPASSTLNFPVGDNRANAVTVTLGAGGTLSVTYAASSLSATTHVIFDVAGYFTPGA
ncbi:MAG: hypothetical protein ABSC46_13115 [Candidatus Limnocylindrales bacterium]|jgi:hypothetical protein